MLNVTTALADDLASAGFGKLQTEDLFKAAIFKVDSKFAREMKASGFENLGMENWLKRASSRSTLSLPDKWLRWVSRKSRLKAS